MKRYEIVWTEYAESTISFSFYAVARNESAAVSKFRNTNPGGVIWKVY